MALPPPRPALSKGGASSVGGAAGAAAHLRGSAVARGPALRRLRRRLAALPPAARGCVALALFALAVAAALVAGGFVAGTVLAGAARALWGDAHLFAVLRGRSFRGSVGPLYVSSGSFRVAEFRPDGKRLEVPEPYGPGAVVIENVLANVTEFIAGGLDVDWDEMAESADAEHMHGRWIGTRKKGVKEAGADGSGRESDGDGERVPLWMPTPFDFTKETEAMKRVAHTKSCFNKRRSNALPLHRPIPDVRPLGCKKQWYYEKTALPGIKGSAEHTYGKTVLSKQRPEILSASGGPASVNGTVDYSRIVLPDTSVVFVMYNEPLSPLLRSIYSVLDRTPPQLLREIIIVDDGSDSEAPWLAPGGEFETHIGYLPKVKLARLKGRNGLMRARNVGIALAKGTTFTILDSHIEVNAGWLEPLMGRIAEGYAQGVHRVVVPAIDSIDADNFEYRAGGIDILGHTWTLGQTGVYRPKSVVGTSPMASPIMAGGLLALDRGWFNELGYYDPLMRLWGGEETEISFRIWQCGGTLECHPCSRVGHIFRSSKHWQGQVYRVPGEVVTRNKLRTASVWMDEYADLVKLASAPLPEDEGIGSLTYMKSIRERLQCRSYSWYLQNVFPEIMASGERLMGQLGSGTLKANGYLRNPETNACVDTLNRKHAGETLGVYPCHFMHGTQAYVAAENGAIVIAELTYSSCFTRAPDFAQQGASRPIFMEKCDDNKSEQMWVSHNKDNRPSWIYEKEAEGGSGTPKGCLTLVHSPEEGNKSPFTLRTQACQEGNKDQLWEWETIGSPKLARSARKT